MRSVLGLICHRTQRHTYILKRVITKMQLNTTPQPDFRSNEMHVKIDKTEGTVSLTFQLLSEFHTMNRGYEECFERSLHRFAITCRSKLAKTSHKAKRVKSKTKGNAPEATSEDAPEIAKPQPPLVTYEGEDCDTSSLQNHEVKTGMIISLDELTFRVVVNPPTVLSLTTYPKSLIYAGCPIVPQAGLENGDDFECIWACESAPGSNDYVTTCFDKVYTPTDSVVGCRVKLFCTAVNSDCASDCEGRTGRSVVFYLSGAVQLAIKEAKEFNRMLGVRQDFSDVQRARNSDRSPTGFHCLDIRQDNERSSKQTRGDRELRAISYNILAEPFATSEQAYVTLYPYCDPQYLQSEYRIQRVLAELLACDPDIVCLQECDLRSFENYLLPLMGRLGYSGHFTCKGSTEGCAVFTYNETCRVVQRVDLPLKNVLREASFLTRLYELRPDLRDVIGGKLGTVAQITVLESVQVPGRALVVANTHLFYHPLASFLRVIQVYAITQALSMIQESIEQVGLQQDFVALVGGEENNAFGDEKETRLCNSVLGKQAVVQSSKERWTGPMKATTMLLGDLNSSPNIAAMQFLLNGFVTEDQLNYVWEEVKYFFWGDREANFNIPSIHELRQQRKAAGTTSNSASDLKHNNHQSNSTDENLITEIDKLNILESEDSAGLQPVMTHTLDFISAAGFAKYSNYTPSFKHLLDYVLVQRRDFEVMRVAPMPNDELLSEFTAMPSAVLPSDHVAIAVDLRWK